MCRFEYSERHGQVQCLCVVLTVSNMYSLSQNNILSESSPFYEEIQMNMLKVGGTVCRDNRLSSLLRVHALVMLLCYVVMKTYNFHAYLSIAVLKQVILSR